LGYHRLDLIANSDIGFQQKRPTTECLYFLHNRFEVRAVNVTQGEIGPGTGEGDGHCAPQAPAGAGDQRHAAVKAKGRQRVPDGGASGRCRGHG
jgi:hypothetical protein